MNSTPDKYRRVGRPKDGSGDDRKARLIKAAGPVFARQGFGATKIADLASAAGVTPAMVHYYFGGKEALLEAAFKEAFAPILAALDKPTTLEAWITLFHANIMEKRWLPHLMLREVIMEGGQLRSHFAAHFGPRFLQKWLTMLDREKTEGRLREDADDFRHIIILMGMVIYPFVVAPMSGYLTGMPFSDEDMARFRDDAIRLFYKGAKG